MMFFLNYFVSKVHTYLILFYFYLKYGENFYLYGTECGRKQLFEFHPKA